MKDYLEKKGKKKTDLATEHSSRCLTFSCPAISFPVSIQATCDYWASFPDKKIATYFNPVKKFLITIQKSWVISKTLEILKKKTKKETI